MFYQVVQYENKGKCTKNKINLSKNTRYVPENQLQVGKYTIAHSLFFLKKTPTKSPKTNFLFWVSLSKLKMPFLATLCPPRMQHEKIQEWAMVFFRPKTQFRVIGDVSSSCMEIGSVTAAENVRIYLSVIENHVFTQKSIGQYGKFLMIPCKIIPLGKFLAVI